MGIEIKELIIRAFVGNQNDDDETEEDADEIENDKSVHNVQDSLAMVANMLKQEKER